MMRRCCTTLTILSLLFPHNGNSFSPPVPFLSQTQRKQKLASVTSLNGRKRGSLGREVTSASEAASVSRQGKKKKTGRKRNRKNSDEDDDEEEGISPGLADWMAKGGRDDTEEGSVAVTTTVESKGDDAEVGFAAFEPQPSLPDSEEVEKTLLTRTKSKKKGGKRRERQNLRRAVDSARQAQISNAISELDSIFSDDDDQDEDKKKEKKKSKQYDLDSILEKIRTLESVEGANSGLRVVSSGSMRKDYRMVWAGSDDAICHVGTGLHKVPLARLQEVFMTLGKNEIEILEVIRILGPFPNVRNTLKGDTSILKPRGGSAAMGAAADPSSSRTKLRITYESMVDGTGKEILAGTDDNVRVVDLDVLFADEAAIVCVIPPEEGTSNEGTDPLGENGSNVLLFFREEELDTKLQILRVS